jgi:PAS domain-containing protein
MHLDYSSQAPKSGERSLLLSHHHRELGGAEFVVFTNSSREIVDCTEGVCRLLGYQREELMKRTIDDVSFQSDQISKLFAEYLRRGQLDGEYVLRHQSGTPVPIRYRAFVFPDGCMAAIWEPINDWRELYLAALIEIDPLALKHKIELALQAIQQRTHELKNAPASPQSEQQSLRDANSALRSLMRTS